MKNYNVKEFTLSLFVEADNITIGDPKTIFEVCKSWDLENLKITLFGGISYSILSYYFVNPTESIIDQIAEILLKGGDLSMLSTIDDCVTYT